jgi:hypothetical protein
MVLTRAEVPDLNRWIISIKEREEKIKDRWDKGLMAR